MTDLTTTLKHPTIK